MTKISLLLCVIVGIFCFLSGNNIPISEQLPIYESLRNTSAIIFGVMGAWIAILYPNALLEIYGKIDVHCAEKQSKNIKQLISPMILSTIIVSFVLIVSLIAPALRKIPFLYCFKDEIRAISFTILGILTYLQLWALLATLTPSNMIQQSFEFITKKRKKIYDKFPNITYKPK